MFSTKAADMLGIELGTLKEQSRLRTPMIGRHAARLELVQECRREGLVTFRVNCRVAQARDPVKDQSLGPVLLHDIEQPLDYLVEQDLERRSPVDRRQTESRKLSSGMPTVAAFASNRPGCS